MKRMNIASPLPSKRLAQALADLRAGKIVILIDAHNRENEADVIAAGDAITPEQINFLARYGRGLICVPVAQSEAHRLGIRPLPVRNPRMLQHCNFADSLDAHTGVTTGISAFDRAHTIQKIASLKSKSSDFSSPGHVFPLIARPGGVLERAGHTEGTIDLLQLAGRRPIGVLCEVMADDGTMLRGKKLELFAKKHRLTICAIEEVIAYRKALQKATNGTDALSTNAKKKCDYIFRDVVANLPTEYGKFQIYGYRSHLDNKEHVALVLGKPKKSKPVLVRIHSECLTGDVFLSKRCDCNQQLHAALQKISNEKEGILIYLRHEGRGIGLINKLKAYNLQDKGFDTFEANEKLGFKADARTFDEVPTILRDLGITKVRLMTNNPAKISAITNEAIEVVERVPLKVSIDTPMLKKYLVTKQKKFKHFAS